MILQSSRLQIGNRLVNQVFSSSSKGEACSMRTLPSPRTAHRNSSVKTVGNDPSELTFTDLKSIGEPGVFVIFERRSVLDANTSITANRTSQFIGENRRE